MKKLVLSAASMAMFTSLSASALNFYPLPQTSTPDISTHYENPEEMPVQCRRPEVIKIIKDLESGSVKWEDLKALNNSVPKEYAGWKTLKDGFSNSQLFDCPKGDLKHSDQGMCINFLQQEPYVIGISNQGGPSDHEPHFHPATECYYVWRGESYINQQEAFRPIKAGETLHIPGSTIHSIPNLSPETLSILWWYPDDANYPSFDFYWRHSAPNVPQIQEAFDKVDRMRTAIGLSPYNTVNYERWYKEKQADVEAKANK